MDRRAANQDITWFLDLNSRKQLDLSPKYQRRSVWTRKDRVFFLDTIFKGYPCPAVFLHKEVDPDTGFATYHVVDGKQRLETILLFATNRITLPRDEVGQSDPSLRGKKFKDLTVEQKQKFWNYTVSVDMLDVVDQAVVDEIFDRLNRNSRKLDRQELRHAKYDGWFINFAEDQSEENSQWKELGIATTGRAKRMKDVQFISELMMASIKEDVSGFSQDELDEFCALYDSPEEDQPGFLVEDFEKRFSDVLNFIHAMNDVNKCVEEYARIFMHFYSLWCFVDRNIEQIDHEAMATKYYEFMSKALNSDVADIDEETTVHHEVYAKNSVGANTEYPQRLARAGALQEALVI